MTISGGELSFAREFLLELLLVVEVLAPEAGSTDTRPIASRQQQLIVIWFLQSNH